ncbi:50S ribosomal protein L25/general stress protein Ctc [Desulfovibrio sp. OttesenSCG-928-C06]|nr:50S ribosomal protein L25/general stress protein Ctc [Desulfovibrio sp. OttesenSCG-928-C06]
MSDFATLQASKRAKTGKGVARRLRMTGQVPAVFYNAKGESMPLQINEKELTRLYASIGRTTVFNIEIEDGAKKEISPALIWDVDYFPIKNRIQHVDIYGVDLDKEIKIRVPLVFTGVAKGTKIGGKLETYREVIDVACKPLSLPQKVEVDITEMGLSDTLRIEDLVLPEGVRAEYNNNYVIVSVISKGAEKEEAAE